MVLQPIIDVFGNQEAQWRETLAVYPATEKKARQGGLTPTKVNDKMLHDIQAVLNRLVGKANKPLGNHTTNRAECWMHMKTKFDGRKVINRPQSGSWEHMCMGAGLRQNMGVEWGPQVWKNMTNEILRQPKKAGGEANMPRQTTQLQLTVLIAGMTMVLRQKKLLMTSPQNIWSN